MSVEIKKHGEKWRVVIKNEEWEFNDKMEMDQVLEKILNWKNKHGSIKNERSY